MQADDGTDGTEGLDPDGIDRRQFVAGAAATTGAVVIAGQALATSPPAPSGIPDLKAAPKPSNRPIILDVQRREDLLHLRFELYNLKRSGTKYVRRTKGRPAYVVVSFVPQHLAERAYNVSEPPKAPGLSRALLARPTRLAFRLKPGKSLSASLGALLDWDALEPSLVPAAAATAAAQAKPGAKRPKLAAPGPRQTGIELPWRLVLSPIAGGRWRHASAPVTLDGWTELWQTHLRTGSADGGAIRAVWNYDRRTGKPTLSRDKAPPASTLPFRSSLDRKNRYEIVRASSDFRVTGRADVRADRLQLSALGGLLDARGAWTGLPAGTFDLTEWRHLATLGRDQYVRIVEKGFLFPFGHKAVKVKITERVFEKVGSQTVATLRQYEYVVVTQAVRSYAAGQVTGLSGPINDLPFSQIEIVTIRTPALDTDAKFEGQAGTFVPAYADKTPFRFAMVGTDVTGRRVDFTVPAVFAGQTQMINSGPAAAIRKKYNDLAADHPYRVAKVGGKTVAFAPPSGSKPGDTDIEVQTITFGAAGGSSGSDASYEKAIQPRTVPVFARAAVRLPAAEQVSGGKPLKKTPVVVFDETYVEHGFKLDKNAAGVFLKTLTESVPPLEFPGGSAGGVMTPNLLITGLSRELGPLGGDLAKLKQGVFDPAEFFKGIAAKILGGVDLIDLLAIVDASKGGKLLDGDVLKITSERDGTKVVTKLEWTPDIVPDNPIIRKTDDFSFALNAEISTDVLEPAKTEFEVVGKLEGFTVNLMGAGTTKFIVITFTSLTFEAKKGKKTDVDVDIATVQFVGALQFVDKLKEFLKFAGEGGPSIDVQPSGVSIDVSIGIPTISIGLFSISNIRIGSGFNLPFDGSPARFRFDFSKRDDPFALQVAIFGGTGFFGLAIGTDGVEQIEAALEFGAMASMDIGVASGGIHLLAGVYFSYGVDPESGDETCILTGYVRMGGELDILGIIHLALEFYMGLTYIGPGKGKVYGEAILTVEIGILFFSFSVELKVRKEFGGGAGGKKKLNRNSGFDGTATFADQMAQADWDEYCDAFATA